MELELRLRNSTPIAAARWKLSHAVGGLGAFVKYPVSCPLTMERFLPLLAELEEALELVGEAHDADNSARLRAARSTPSPDVKPLPLVRGKQGA